MNDLVIWLADLPTGVLFLGLLVAGMVCTIALSWLVRHFIEDDIRTKSSSSVTTVVGVVAGLYAVLVTFVIVNEWQTFNDAQAHVSAEAAALTAASFDTSVLPEPTRTTIRDAIVAYDRSVVCAEIPYLADHQGPNASTRAALRHLFEVVADAPHAAQESAFYTSLVAQLAQVARARHDRITAASSPLPDLLLVVILVTRLALIAVASALDTKHRRWHLVLTTALVVLVALSLTLILTLSRPFDGGATVSDSPLREGVPSELLRCGD